ncbi:Gfo/Idh/MocA family oxidoreductase [Pseudomonas putida]
MNSPCKTLVVGSRFGQFYAAGVKASDAYQLVGVLGQGSRRSQALARQLGVPSLDSLAQVPGDTRLACVAVGGAARGEGGVAVAEALLARGIDVLIEHPLLPAEMAALYRTAQQHGRRCLVNGFYPQLPAVAHFIAMASALHRAQGLRHVQVGCSVQVSYAALEIVAAALGNVAPWSLAWHEPGRGGCADLELVMAEVPMALNVVNQLAAADDGRMQRLMTFSVACDSGTLLLASPHGPLVWTPAIAAPDEDDDGLFVFNHCASLPGVQSWFSEVPDWATIHGQLWPQAAVAALAPLQDGAGLALRQQRSLEVASLWQQLTATLGFPGPLCGRWPPATLEQAMAVAP